jgi:NADP-dependent 3-hydroxy acid dehydrogenase YdfG
LSGRCCSAIKCAGKVDVHDRF